MPRCLAGPKKTLALKRESERSKSQLNVDEVLPK